MPINPFKVTPGRHRAMGLGSAGGAKLGGASFPLRLSVFLVPSMKDHGHSASGRSMGRFAWSLEGGFHLGREAKATAERHNPITSFGDGSAGSHPDTRVKPERGGKGNQAARHIVSLSSDPGMNDLRGSSSTTHITHHHASAKLPHGGLKGRIAPRGLVHTRTTMFPNPSLPKVRPHVWPVRSVRAQAPMRHPVDG
ncbi:uncharacterized protein N7459_005421 [Penicillium hispanicum]|uniref:uncharacterized protein n=1 Tax=Penicillium hispanicum TaxID=1080232 RepID=UPI002541A853|nr:uncharacterized protein N7459_005421 [Penicillium hispanicum]KAJ5585621.1 hypothetical protein N7459_005421 [Penicillium hispanicum]